MKHQWPDTIERMTFGLSPGNPVKFIPHQWASRHVSQFDMHFGMELGVILSGKMVRHYRSFGQTLTPGNVWICSLWEPHGFHLKQAPCSAAVFMIYPPLVSNLRFEEDPELNISAAFQAAPCDRPQSEGNVKSRVLQIARDVYDLGGKENGFPKAFVRIKLLEILLLLMTDWPGAKSSAPLACDTTERLNPALELVFCDSGHVSALAAAQACHMHRNTFRKNFQDAMGLNFPEFALRYRVTRAASELLAGDKPIKTIASQWGFSDTSHFARTFARYYHKTPMQYRNAR